MQNAVEHLVQMENGPRWVQQGQYLGHKITVVTGYDVTHDDWPFHIYVEKDGGPRQGLTEKPTRHRANTVADAFEQGMAIAVQELTPRKTSFQTEVK